MVPGLVILSLMALALAYWGFWLSTKPRVPMRLAKILRWSFLVLTPLPALGMLWTYLGIVHAFEAVDAADASDKARALAEGISEAMNATAFAILILFAETCVLLLFTARYVWSKPDEPDVPGDPPYR